MAKYSITYKSTFDEDYYNIKNERCIRTELERYDNISKEVCLDVLKNMMDIPDHPLTDDEIRKDFGSITYPLSDEKVKEIQNYYNGRLEIYKRIISNFDNIMVGMTEHHDIPMEYNSFSVDGSKFSQIDAYVEIKKTE